MISGGLAPTSSPLGTSSLVRASAIDATLLNYTDAISDFGYRTETVLDTNDVSREAKGNKIGDFGRMGNSTLYLMGINPTSLFDDNIHVEYNSPESDLPLTEQLYTARGAQGLGVSNMVAKYGVEPENLDEQLELSIFLNPTMPLISYAMRPLWTGKGIPNFEFNWPWGFISMPLFCQLSNSTMDSMIY